MVCVASPSHFARLPHLPGIMSLHCSANDPSQQRNLKTTPLSEICSKTWSWTWADRAIDWHQGQWIHIVQFIWESNQIAKRNVLFSLFAHFRWFVSESRASKKCPCSFRSFLHRLGHKYCIPHVHPFWDHLHLPNPCASMLRLVMHRVKDHDGWIYHNLLVIFLGNLNHLWLVVGPPLWKIWKSIGMIRNPIFLGK